jgi:hypothetical protein
VDGGAIAAGVIFGLLGAAIIGVIVYAKFFGGGPAVAAAWASMKSATAKATGVATGWMGTSKVERTSLLRPAAAGSAATAARFAPIGGAADPY